MATTTTAAERTQDLAQELFTLVTQICLSSLRGRRRHGNLKEVEFLTLSLLHAHGTMIVGNIQRLLGILPAQMSRVIRALENRDRPLIRCRINADDKRKIDVCLTAHGEKALLDFQNSRVNHLAECMRDLADDDHDELLRVLGKLHVLLDHEPT